MTRGLLLVAAAIAGLLQGQARQSGPGHAYAFVNGNWFDGRTFRADSFYSDGGVFVRRRPAHIDSVIDLTGRYAVPPYAEAHNHNIDGFKNVGERIARYLADGVYYIKNPNSIPQRTSGLAGMINTPTSVDVVFSNGGLTATGGHPLELVRRNIGLGILTEQDAEGGMYYTIDNEDDLQRKWPAITGAKPDFIKTYLLYSEEFSRRRDDTAYFGWKGLDPSLLPKIVERAHRDGLRVSTHIETASDFHNALEAGADEINHMPGFRADSSIDFSRYEISKRDAQEAAAKGVTVVTTLAGSSTAGSPEYREKLRRLHFRNLGLLREAGVSIAVGSDDYRKTSVEEAFYLHDLGVFTNAELLRIWCQTSAATIFPARKIGRLQEGYEASFLVLDGDPLPDFARTRNIVMRVKQGELLPDAK